MTMARDNFTLKSGNVNSSLETELLEKGERFTLHEGHHIHDFEWLAFERLQDEYFYPIFLKTSIFNLPEQFTIRTEYE